MGVRVHKCIYVDKYVSVRVISCVYTAFYFVSNTLEDMIEHLPTSSMYTHLYLYRWDMSMRYDMATVSRLLKIIGLFCRILSLL